MSRIAFFSAHLSFIQRVGDIRGDSPMQVVSGRPGRYKGHFEAPPRQKLGAELTLFLEWFNTSKSDVSLDPFLRAALTHLWFVTMHPFVLVHAKLFLKSTGFYC